MWPAEILSAPVAEAVALAIAHGNRIADVTEGWERVRQVVRMQIPLDDATRAELRARFPALRHWQVDGTPHDPPSEGFTSDEDEVSVSFPRRGLGGARWAL